MFQLPIWQFSITSRAGAGQWLAEAVATFGLLLTIFGCAVKTPAAIPYAVGLYITSAYWFTASIRQSGGDDCAKADTRKMLSGSL